MADLEAGHRMSVVRCAGFRRSRGGDADRRGARDRQWFRKLVRAKLSVNLQAGRRIHADGGLERRQRPLVFIAGGCRPQRMAAVGLLIGSVPVCLGWLLGSVGSAGRSVATDEPPSAPWIRHCGLCDWSYRGDACAVAGRQSSSEESAGSSQLNATFVELRVLLRLPWSVGHDGNADCLVR
jgi:hypothetical protein